MDGEPNLSPAEQIAAAKQQLSENIGRLLSSPDGKTPPVIAEDSAVRRTLSLLQKKVGEGGFNTEWINQRRSRIETLYEEGKISDSEYEIAIASIGQVALFALPSPMEAFAESMRPSGEASLVQAEYRQRAVNPDYFLPQLDMQAWYRDAPETKKTEVGARVQILAGVSMIKTGKLENIIGNPYLTMRREELRSVLVINGVWETTQKIMIDLFERDPEETHYFALRLKADAPEKLSNFEEMRMKLRQQLQEQGLSELDAMKTVAIAWNFLFLGNTVESADKTRKAFDYITFSGPDRTFIHPLSQALNKWRIGKEFESPERVAYDEAWGGLLVRWVITRREHDPNFAKNLASGKIPPFKKLPYPKTMFLSFPEFLVVQKEDGRDISLAEALMTGRKVEGINWSAIDADPFATWKDFMDSAFKVYLFLVNNKPEEGDWMVLRGALAKLRNPAKSFPLTYVYRDSELLAWCILADYGLHPNSSPPLATTPASERGYSHFMSDMVKALGLADEERKEVLRLVGAKKSRLTRTLNKF